jgi:hypothetical protein
MSETPNGAEMEPLDDAVDHVRGGSAGRLIVEYVVYPGNYDAATLLEAIGGP